LINISILIFGLPPLVYLLNTHTPVKKYARNIETELTEFPNLNVDDEHQGLSYRSNYKERLISNDESENNDKETGTK